jgi:V8-like Glu-specific endopeptidase
MKKIMHSLFAAILILPAYSVNAQSKKLALDQLEARRDSLIAAYGQVLPEKNKGVLPKFPSPNVVIMQPENFFQLAKINKMFGELQVQLYGKDNRKDFAEGMTVYNIPTKKIEDLTKSVCAIVHKSAIDDTDPKKPKLKRSSLTESPSRGPCPSLCDGVTFKDQKGIELLEGTGVIISSKRVLLAFHILEDKKIEDYRVLLDYTINTKDVLDPDDIKKITSHVPKMDKHKDVDFDVIEIEGSFSKAHNPSVEFNKVNDLHNGDDVFMMGFPSGLPLKIADSAQVFLKGNEFFCSNLDAFAGNSGSPVFNKNGRLEGILVAGAKDYILKRENVCCELTSFPISISENKDREIVLLMFSILGDYAK